MGGHGGGSGSILITLSPGAGPSTAFDNVNPLSAPRVEHERPFYCIEKGEHLSQLGAVREMSKHATVRGSWGRGDALMTIRWPGA